MPLSLRRATLTATRNMRSSRQLLPRRREKDQNSCHFADYAGRLFYCLLVGSAVRTRLNTCVANPTSPTKRIVPLTVTETFAILRI